MSFVDVISGETRIQTILNKQFECIRTIKKSQDKSNINLIIKKALKNNNYTIYMISLILNNEEETMENKNRAVCLYLEWLDIMRTYISNENKEINKLMWRRIFDDFKNILDCKETEFSEKLEYELFKTASLLKKQEIKILEPVIRDTFGIEKYKIYNDKIKRLLKGGKKKQYTLPTQIIEKRMENFGWFGGRDTSVFFDVFLEFFVIRDSQVLPNLQKKIIETDKAELLEKAIEKNIIKANTREELLEYALKKECSKMIMELILL